VSRALTIISFVGQRIPLRAGQRLGRAIGTFAWHVLRRERRRALKHIAFALPEWSEEQRRKTIRAMFQHFGITLFEIIWLRKGDAATRARMTRMEGGEPLKAILASGRSVMIVSGHCGNWEWSAHEVATLGPMAAWQRERDDPEMNRFMIELREVSGIRSIGRGSSSSPKELLRALRKGVMLTVLMDQNIRAASVKVPFFGHPALTPIGLA
jgi:KDO2-lipid IV(A) lauroyltransferase